MDRENISKAADLIVKSRHCIAFTGAGISVESGIPPFRGDDGLWSKYDPSILELDNYYNNPEKVWPIVRELFYDFFIGARPNDAHIGLATLEKMGLIKAIVTQNIDNLHQEAGSEQVFEFHGNSRQFVCLKDKTHVFPTSKVVLNESYPKCPGCGHLLKPDFIFFGEQIPTEAYLNAEKHAQLADVVIIVGSTGEVIPASFIPHKAKQHGATIIEINPSVSTFTYSITDTLIKEKSGSAMKAIVDAINA